MNLTERLKVLIEKKTSASKRYKELEEMTGIPAGTWKTFYARGVRPSADLIEGVAKRFPRYSEWLLTGAITGRAQTTPMQIDLTELDDDIALEPIDTQEVPVSRKELEQLVESFFSQLSKKKKPKNGN